MFNSVLSMYNLLVLRYLNFNRGIKYIIYNIKHLNTYLIDIEKKL